MIQNYLKKFPPEILKLSRIKRREFLEIYESKAEMPIWKL